jgi:hypothetical protein
MWSFLRGCCEGPFEKHWVHTGLWCDVVSFLLVILEKYVSYVFRVIQNGVKDVTVCEIPNERSF